MPACRRHVRRVCSALYKINDDRNVEAGAESPRKQGLKMSSHYTHMPEGLCTICILGKTKKRALFIVVYYSLVFSNKTFVNYSFLSFELLLIISIAENNYI